MGVDGIHLSWQGVSAILVLSIGLAGWMAYISRSVSSQSAKLESICDTLSSMASNQRDDARVLWDEFGKLREENGRLKERVAVLESHRS